MNIVMFAGGGDIGGAKTHILSLGQQLAREDSFHLVSFRPGPFADEARALGLDVTVVTQAWNLFSCLSAALKAVDKQRPDVLHCHGAKANMLGAVVKWLRHVPLLTTVHSDPLRDYMGMPIKQLLFGSINRLALRCMDYYMSVARGMEETLIRRGVDPQKIFVIHNGLDFSASDPNSRPQHSADDDVVVGVAARLTPIKDLPTLLRAFARAYAKDQRLLLRIAGTGEDEHSLKALAQELGVAQRVEFAGWVTDMGGFFSHVDINVLTSLSETFPYSLLEGAFDHCPAIASRVGGIPELIEHERTGLLFEAGDADTLAEHLLRLSGDANLRQRLGDALYQRARDEFSLERMGCCQREAYQRVLLRRSRRQERQGAVICGAYGRGNAGDEAILRSIVAQMRQIDSEMPLTVLSRDKLDTRLQNKTNAIYIFNIPQFLRRLRRARIFINGGGSLIQDVTSSRSLFFYLFTLWAARLCGCRVIMYGCGIGPIKRRHNRKLAARVLNRNVEIVTLRDSNSVQVLQQIGVDRPEILLSADPTVNLQAAPWPRIQAVMRCDRVPEQQAKIAFCLRNWPSFTQYAAVAAAADYAFERYGLLPVFIPIETPRDVDAAQRVGELMRSPYVLCRQRYPVDELIGLLGQMRLTVGMRLHSLIFSTLAATPVIGLSYDVKVSSFISDIGSTRFLPVEQLTAPPLCELIDAVMADPERAETARSRLDRGEQINIDCAKRLLGVD